MADPLTPEQAAAVRPSRSAWISANAGSGKTRVLTARVARCLLDGVRPDRILCLTYTRAAAGEMKTRLFATLGGWAMCADDELRAELDGLLEPGEQARFDPRSLANARRLFAQALEFPGGLKIQTIHSFGLSLLRRFPREAGLSPGVSILDERRIHALAEEAFEETLRDARADDGSLGQAYRAIVAEGRTGSLDPVRDAILLQRSAYRAFAARHAGEAQDAAIRRFLGDDDNAAEADLLAATAELHSQADRLERVAGILAERGGVRDQKRLPHLHAAIDAIRSGDGTQAVRRLRKGLLNKDGSRPSRPFSKAVGEALESEDLWGCVLSVWSSLDVIENARRIAAVAEASIAAARIAAEFLDRFARAKRAEAGLDYEDVIEHVSALLHQGEAREWIRYRLDGGIDHILVDEAQDTSPAQWAALKRLAEEFFTGDADAERRRTIFAVGDEKQSIFSFQGAAPEEFASSCAWFESRTAEQGDPLYAGSLQTSFRSSPAVLEFVDAVFRPESYGDGDGNGGAGGGSDSLEPEHWASGLIGFDDPLAHRAHHAGRAGRVEVWDLFDPNDPDLESADTGADVPPEKLVARRVGDRITTWIREAVPLPGSDRPIDPRDIMVLVQRRGVFTDELVRCLRLNGIPVAGADRIGLTGHIAVQDLLALVAFALLPTDDFTLAVLLRSPFCGVSEEDLFALARDRGRESLFARLEAAAEGGEEQLRPAYAFLSDMQNAVAEHGPYEYLERALSFHGGRRKLLARLGEDAIEPIDALLAEAIAFQNRERGSLEEFLWRVRSGETFVKADASAGPSAVRIMTIHGAKGLEAPIVIVPDANRVPNFAARERAFVGTDSDGCAIPLYVQRKDDDTPQTANLRAERQSKELQESYRLLYVALTRAEKWLVVCGGKWRRRTRDGATAGRGANQKCWHFRAEAAARRIGAPIADKKDRQRLGAIFPGFVIDRGDTAQAELAAADGADTQRIEAPDWALSPATPEARTSAWTAASSLGGGHETPQADEAQRHRAGASADAALAKGSLTHLLLERLAGFPADGEREALARGLAARFGDPLAETDREAVVTRVFRILDEPELRHLFRAEGLAEAWVALRLPDSDGGVWGRIDRLVLENGRALIVDFKGDPEPAPSPEATGSAYLAQLGAYRRAVSQIYPDHKVSAAILWTSAEPPSLMGHSRLADGYRV